MTRRNAIPAWLTLLAAVCAKPAAPADRLDPTLSLVLGGGISAGFSGFHLTEVAQNQAWPVLAAKQMASISPSPPCANQGRPG